MSIRLEDCPRALELTALESDEPGPAVGSDDQAKCAGGQPSIARRDARRAEARDGDTDGDGFVRDTLATRAGEKIKLNKTGRRGGNRPACINQPCRQGFTGADVGECGSVKRV